MKESYRHKLGEMIPSREGGVTAGDQGGAQGEKAGGARRRTGFIPETFLKLEVILIPLCTKLWSPVSLLPVVETSD